MAYDLRLGKTKSDAAASSPAAQIEMRDHDHLFDDLRARPGDFRVLVKLSDQSRDAAIWNSEVPALLEEVRSALQMDVSPRSVEILQVVQAVGRTALAEGTNVFCFCD